MEGLIMDAKDMEMKQKIAYLAYVNKQILCDLKTADELLKSIGFEHGLSTVKEAALEIIGLQEEAHEHSADGEDDSF